MRVSSILIIIIAVIFAGGCKKNGDDVKAAPAGTSTMTAVSETVDEYIPPQTEYGTVDRCPISGDKVVVGKNTSALKYKNKVYYFCCPACLSGFKSNPSGIAK